MQPRGSASVATIPSHNACRRVATLAPPNPRDELLQQYIGKWVALSREGAALHGHALPASLWHQLLQGTLATQLKAWSDEGMPAGPTRLILRELLLAEFPQHPVLLEHRVVDVTQDQDGITAHVEKHDTIEDIEFGNAQSRHAIDLNRTLECCRIKPTTSTRPTGDRSKLMSFGCQVLTNIICELRRERTAADARAVRLREAHDRVDARRADADAGARAARDGARRRDEWVGAVVDVEKVDDPSTTVPAGRKRVIFSLSSHAFKCPSISRQASGETTFPASITGR